MKIRKNLMANLTLVDKKWHCRADVKLSVYRTELLTLSATGNKQFKLAENLLMWKKQGVQRVLSFGGAWSNHLHALAIHAGRQGITSVGIVRGEEGVSNPILQSAVDHGMEIHHISRQRYQHRHNKEFCQQLARQHGCDKWLPEGGSNGLAVSGCRELGTSLLSDLRLSETGQIVIAIAVGTGATLAGIVSSCGQGARVVGFPVVRDQSVVGNIENWLAQSLVQGATDCSWSLWPDEIVPGYGKVDKELMEFVIGFFADTGVCLDPVYTGKVMHKITSSQFVEALPSNTHVVLVHTGGLAGSLGFKRQFENAADPMIVESYFKAIRQLTGL